jgi:hypothetical protein
MESYRFRFYIDHLRINELAAFCTVHLRLLELRFPRMELELTCNVPVVQPDGTVDAVDLPPVLLDHVALLAGDFR